MKASSQRALELWTEVGGGKGVRPGLFAVRGCALQARLDHGSGVYHFWTTRARKVHMHMHSARALRMWVVSRVSSRVK